MGLQYQSAPNTHYIYDLIKSRVSVSKVAEWYGALFPTLTQMSLDMKRVWVSALLIFRARMNPHIQQRIRRSLEAAPNLEYPFSNKVRQGVFNKILYIEFEKIMRIAMYMYNYQVFEDPEVKRLVKIIHALPIHDLIKGRSETSEWTDALWEETVVSFKLKDGHFVRSFPNNVYLHNMCYLCPGKYSYLCRLCDNQRF